MKTTNFERAIFLSWYCSKGDCSFCYMSTQKKRISDPKKARRSFASIFAEAIITKACGWDIEFISGGYESYSLEDIKTILKTIHEISEKKLFINIGTLTKKELTYLKPHIQGFTGAVECLTPNIRKKVCPSKPLKPIIDSFKACEGLGLKKAMTLIIGLGETIDDFSHLKKFIDENDVSQITFYSLNPQKGTPYKKSPEIGYYEKWIKKTRKFFPKLKIIAGAWHDKTNYFSRLLLAGADSITKLPAIKIFGTKKAVDVEKEIKLANRRFLGTLTKLPGIDWDDEVDKLGVEDELKEKVKVKLHEYLKKMKL